MGKFNNYAKRMNEIANAAFSEYREKEAAVKSAESRYNAYPRRNGADPAYMAKSARAEADLAEARNAFDQMRRHLFDDKRREIAAVRAELEKAVFDAVHYGVLGALNKTPDRPQVQFKPQPAPVKPEHLLEAQQMAAKVTEALTGAGIWGVEFFLSNENGVYFSELSPRPHDTGMVTLAGTQNLSEFELHCRAVLGLPIPEITQERYGASAVILSDIARYNGVNPDEVKKEIAILNFNLDPNKI